MTTCLNCGNSFKGHYCPNCGQKAQVERLTFPVLVEEVIHTFTHLEKGFLFTTWNLMVRPGTTSLNYLHGKRKKYQKPVSFFFIWIGLYILVHNIIVNHYHYQLSEINFIGLDLRQRANILLRSHFLIFIIPIIAVSAIVIYTLLARPLFNFIEILTISTYGGGNYFMILFFSDIVLGAIFKINIVTNGVFIGQTILSAVYNFWFSFDIFTRVHIHFLWLRLICVAILVPLIGWGMMELLPAAWISLTK